MTFKRVFLLSSQKKLDLERLKRDHEALEVKRIRLWFAVAGKKQLESKRTVVCWAEEQLSGVVGRMLLCFCFFGFFF